MGSPAQAARLCPAGRLSPAERRLLLRLLDAARRMTAVKRALAPKLAADWSTDGVDVEVLALKLREETLHHLLAELEARRPKLLAREIAALAGCSREEVSRWRSGRR